MLLNAALLSTPLPDAGRAQSAHPALGGTWQLNEEKSEKYDPSRERALGRDDATGANVKTGMGPRTSGRAGGGGGGGGADGGGAPGGTGGATGLGADRQVMAAMGEATKQPSALTIEQTDSTVTISSGRRQLVVRPDGESLADSTLEGVVVYSVKAEWKKDQLVVEKRLAGGTSVRSTYYVDKKDPKVLIVDVRFESKSLRRTIDNRRVYNSQ
jgi:hypothetical protein